jgi:hypothetical protein
MPKKATKSAKRAASKSIEPQLAVAVFCERAIADSDGVYTVIRIVDQLKLQGPVIPPAGTMIAIPIAMLIGFKAGTVKGKLPVSLTQVDPNGSRTSLPSREMKFNGEMTGSFLYAERMGIKYGGNGVYWFEFRLNNKLYVKLPLLVEFELL